MIMNILLINPSGGPESEYGALAKASAELPQIGLTYIAAVLSKSGHNVRIVDFHAEALTIDDLLKIIIDGDYKFIGFSVYITTIQKTLELARLVKNKSPETIVACGGPQVTLDPDSFTSKDIDYLFLGESELTLLQLVNDLEKNQEIPSLPTGVLRNRSGILEGERKLSLILDLDVLPLINFEDFYDLSNFYPPVHMQGNKIINIQSQRGCPFKCTFCAAAEVSGRKLRQMSVERFMDQIQLYVDNGYDSFMIYDDTMTIDRKRVLEICNNIKKRGIKILWNCWGRADTVDADMLLSMREAGCYQIMFGHESLNDKTLKLLKKGFSVEKGIKAIELAHAAGIRVATSFMIGIPGETRADILHTIHTAINTPLDIAFFLVFEPCHGTPIYDECLKKGRWIEGNKNLLLVEQDTTWVPDGFEREEIEQLAHYAYRKFYLRLSYIPKFLKIIKSLSWARRFRFVSSGLDYFVLQKIAPAKKYLTGSRYR
jgi:anaerobic magnesium-protoporphyrin IX monomethyl ester cyclase